MVFDSTALGGLNGGLQKRPKITPASPPPPPVYRDTPIEDPNNPGQNYDPQGQGNGDGGFPNTGTGNPNIDPPGQPRPGQPPPPNPQGQGGEPPPVQKFPPVPPGDTGIGSGNPWQMQYDAAKGALEAETKTKMAGAITDAQKRGVYYGTPLTTSQGDMNSDYLRSLASLQADTAKNYMDDQFRRQALAAQLMQQQGGPAQSSGGMTAEQWAALMGIFGQPSEKK